MNTQTTANVSPTDRNVLRQIAEANLDAARERYAVAEGHLVNATLNGACEGKIQWLEGQLDAHRAVLHECQLDIEELTRRDRSDENAAYADEHPDRVFEEVLEANGDAHVLAASRRRLEREYKRCASLGYSTLVLEREIKTIRAALHVVTRSPDWLERAREEREAISDWADSVVLAEVPNLEERRKWAAEFRREGGGVQVGLMSLADYGQADHSEVA